VVIYIFTIFYKYALSLICFARKDISEQSLIEVATWDVKWDAMRNPFRAKHINDSMFVEDLITWHFYSVRAHQTRRSVWLLRLGFNEIAQFLSKSEVLVALISLFKSVFFSPIIILFLQYSHRRSSHVPEIWPIQGLMFNILFQTR
jgi:hypothetical protein